MVKHLIGESPYRRIFNAMIPSFSWRRAVPRTAVDRFSVLVSTCEILVEGLELSIVLPRVYAESALSYWFCAILGLFLFVNLFGNFIMAMGVENSSRSVVLPAVLKPGWSYCHSCQTNSPPRAFHCSECGKCVLKRDHHCIFMGCCIGHANQRYYLMCIMYIGLLTVYASYISADLAVQCIGENLNLTTLIASFTPVLAWMYGLVQPLSFFIAFQSGTCLYCFFIFTALFLYHALIVLRGQTTHEFRRLGDRSYDQGWLRNIRGVLGTRWYFVWVFPLVTSPLPGDGVHFVESGSPSLEEVKDL
ncbi:probable palmitoyltransferase ZDHHC24 [Acanthaster planci]|uniref:Palmitoyltransferase n=1 Tax=Acanthaster planci TaxID=133434 RepID=A0A8B7Z2J0_ACAPL|nr:probable palmitoyltransferase ZDHHC24 [Acanthaster planci]